MTARLTRLAQRMTDPAELVYALRDRREIRRDVRLPQPPGVVGRPAPAVLSEAADALGADAHAALDDAELAALEAELAQRERTTATPFPPEWSSSLTLARLCYSVIRLTTPAVVLETGVGAGRTSAFITAALERNGAGVLHSVDPLIGERGVGVLVPARSRDRWHPHRGRSRRVLPRLLSDLAPIDVFLHDGLHTYPTMRWELAAAAPHLGRPAVVLMDDAELNPAFAEWATASTPAVWSLVQTEHPGHLCGLAVFT